jgi:hypothetical protein
MAQVFSPRRSALPTLAIPHWWYDAAGAIQSTVHRALAARADRVRRPPRHYPARFQYLETACMSREMDRL